MDFSEQQIKSLKTVVGQVVDNKIRLNNDLIFQEMKAMENRLEGKIDEKIKASEERILHGVAQMVEDNVVPQIEDHEANNQTRNKNRPELVQGAVFDFTVYFVTPYNTRTSHLLA